jgi:hypothetical protein
VKSLPGLLFLAFVLHAVSQEQSKPMAQPLTVIRAGTLLDGKSDKPRHDQIIVVRGNRIESVADSASAKVPAGATVVDLSQQTVLPGSPQIAQMLRIFLDIHPHTIIMRQFRLEGACFGSKVRRRYL